MNRAILNPLVQDFIQEHIQTDVTQIGLAKSPFPDISPGELAEQIDAKKRCEHKLPTWFTTPGLYYPQKLAIEQASSELAARYKSNIIIGDDIIDLTGGIGVDSYFFALKTKNVTHCELNKSLSEISEYNSHVLGVTINYQNINGLDYLHQTDKIYNTAYIDPSRRAGSKKVFFLRDCEPDVANNLKFLKSRCDFLLIKTAPLLDIRSTINELKQVQSIHVVSIKNECKEVLYLIDCKDEETDPLIICAMLGAGDEKIYSFKLSEERAFRINTYSEPLKYIYEPDVALLKAGCFKLITRDFDIHKIQTNTHLYTSHQLELSFPGRKFLLKKSWNYGAFLKNHTFNKANIICRNFPLDPEQLKKKLKIGDGGNEYLIFCTGHNNERLVLNCERT